MKLRELTHLSALLAASLTMFAVESQLALPFIPLPGIKLGLANIITILAVCFFSPAGALLLTGARVLLAGIFGGGLLSAAYGLAGGFCCVAVMACWRSRARREPSRLPLLSLTGALAHNLGQLAVACMLTQSSAVLYYLPLLACGGAAAGLTTGLLAQRLLASPARPYLLPH